MYSSIGKSGEFHNAYKGVAKQQKYLCQLDSECSLARTEAAAKGHCSQYRNSYKRDSLFLHPYPVLAITLSFYKPGQNILVI